MEGQLIEYSFCIDKLSKFLIQTLEAKAKKVYYVRKTIGSDDNDGLSPDTAFLTIQKAASTTQSGDIVFVGAGDYQEEVSIKDSGTSQNPISFVADTNGNYTGDSGEVKISGINYGIYIDGKTHIKIYGFKITHSQIAGIYIGGTNPQYIDIINNEISGNSGDGIEALSGSDILISHNKIFSNKKGVYLKSSSSQIIKNQVYQNASGGIFVEKGNFVEIKFNEVFSNSGNGILVSDNANNNTVEQNLVYSNSLDGISVFDHASQILVIKNISHSNSGNGISFKNNISNANKLAANLVFKNSKNGILISENCVNNEILNNTSYKNSENGILIEEDSSNNEIYNNIFSENSGAGISVSDSGNIDLSYNDLWQNNPNYQGISSGENDISADPLFFNPDNNDFHLSQISAGQSQDSPCLDAGSDNADEIEINSQTLDDLTTRTDNIKDSGIVDIGFHYSLDSPPSLPSVPDPFGAPISNANFDLRGDKIVGKDASENSIYKYSVSTSTDSNGFLKIENLEWDSYTFSNFSAGGINLDLIVSYPSLAIEGKTKVNLNPDSTTTVRLGLKAENTLLVKVQDSTTTNPIFAASVRLYKTGYDQTKFTDENGEVYFIPLEKTTYNLEVAAGGYATSTTNVFVNSQTTKTISLIKL